MRDFRFSIYINENESITETFRKEPKKAIELVDMVYKGIEKDPIFGDKIELSMKMDTTRDYFHEPIIS